MCRMSAGREFQTDGPATENAIHGDMGKMPGMASKVAIQNAEMSKFVVPCLDERSYHS